MPVKSVKLSLDTGMFYNHSRDKKKYLGLLSRTLQIKGKFNAAVTLTLFSSS